MFYVYILQSINFQDKFYIGYTSDLKRRLYEHNHKMSAHTKNMHHGK
ncbi:MAG: GIY-YIG nuclease family protein [Alphaproteobacteria bacterium]|nr:GIY-YIG nuclease family protein [Alphaproteobacteria bacterium]